MSMSEVIERKAAIDAAIGAHDAERFADHFQPWLEATAYLRTRPNFAKLGMEPGAILQFNAVDLRDVGTRKEADDAVMGFCIAAGLARDAAAFTALDKLLTQSFGIIYPGSSALYHCNQTIDPIVTLDDAVGQVLKSLFEGEDFAPDRLWNAGLRLLQRLRSSNFERELTPILGAWLRAQWEAVIAGPNPALNPDAVWRGIRAALDDERADQSFIAALLLAAGAAIENLAINPEYLNQLAKLAQRG